MTFEGGNYRVRAERLTHGRNEHSMMFRFVNCIKPEYRFQNQADVGLNPSCAVTLGRFPSCSEPHFSCLCNGVILSIQAGLRDTVALIPHHRNKVNIAMK